MRVAAARRLHVDNIGARNTTNGVAFAACHPNRAYGPRKQVTATRSVGTRRQQVSARAERPHALHFRHLINGSQKHVQLHGILKS